jgi:hypothetical protein
MTVTVCWRSCEEQEGVKVDRDFQICLVFSGYETLGWKTMRVWKERKTPRQVLIVQHVVCSFLDF